MKESLQHEVVQIFNKNQDDIFKNILGHEKMALESFIQEKIDGNFEDIYKGNFDSFKKPQTLVEGSMADYILFHMRENLFNDVRNGLIKLVNKYLCQIKFKRNRYCPDKYVVNIPIERYSVSETQLPSNVDRIEADILPSDDSFQNAYALFKKENIFIKVTKKENKCKDFFKNNCRIM